MASIPGFAKQPSERLDYDIDLSNAFADGDNDGIDSSGSVTLVTTGSGSDPDLQIDGSPIVINGPLSRLVKVWLKGGVTGTSYELTATLTTHNGRIIEQDFIVKVKEI